MTGDSLCLRYIMKKELLAARAALLEAGHPSRQKPDKVHAFVARSLHKRTVKY